MEYRILIIEDDADINNLLKEILESAGYKTVQAFSGTEARLCLNEGLPDLVFLDLMLPGMTGQEFLRYLREEKRCSMPVLVLSAKNALEDKVGLLRMGADDYITKPFEPKEVAARAQAALRRSHINDAREHCAYPALTYKNIKLYPESRKVTILGKEAALTGTEYEILYLLIQNPEKAFSRESIYEQVWKDGYYGTDHTVNVHVSNLRKKIKEYDPHGDYVQSIYGIGFRLAKS